MIHENFLPYGSTKEVVPYAPPQLCLMLEIFIVSYVIGPLHSITNQE